MSAFTAPLNTVAADYGFRETDGPQGSKRFVVTPPPYGGAATGFLVMMWLGIGLPGGLVGGFVLWGMLTSSSGRGPSFLLCVLIAWLLTGGLIHWWIRSRMNKQLHPVTLAADATGLDVDGRRYARGDIRSIWVTQPRQANSGTVVVSHSWNAGAAQAGQIMGQAVAGKFAERGFGVAIRYGGQEIKIVDQVHEGVATELAQRLQATLQL
ncbi:MAG TPA: hypothetical protein VJN44_18860 [Roseateles sp.]|nr:hypothetical protein [Roseateles sp.]